MAVKRSSWPILFVIILSVALVAWARATADVVRIPAVASPILGLAVTLIGFTLLLPGLARGICRLFPQPIYTGFCIVCAGVSIAAGSASGLWLVSPIVALGCTAFVLGYERHHPQERFGPAPTRLLPDAGLLPPAGIDRLKFYLFVLLPWLVLYEAVLAIGTPPDAISGVSRFEQRLPVMEWSQIFYASTYFLTIFAPVFAKTRSDLRRYAVCALWTMLVAYPAFLIVPLIAPKRPFTPHTLPGHLLLWERTLDSPVAAFPSFHVIWAMLAARVFARRWPSLKWLFYGWAILVAASCVTTSQHSILDVLGGAATVALVTRGPQLWGAIRRQAGHTANSWQEWKIGPVLLINHGFYAGAGAFFAVLLAGTLAGPRMQTGIFVSASAAVVAAAVWALSMRAPWSQATPVYSIPCNVAIALILTRLWILAAPLHMIAGLYFILAGLSRFAEEGWRGEPRTPVFLRLRIPQWVAVASVVGGALMTALGRGAAAPAAAFGAAVALAMSVDSPNTNKKWASLSLLREPGFQAFSPPRQPTR